MPADSPVWKIIHAGQASPSTTGLCDITFTFPWPGAFEELVADQKQWVVRQA